MSEVPEVMRCVRLCMLEAVEDTFCLLEVLQAMRRVLLYMLKGVWIWRWSLKLWRYDAVAQS